MKHLKIVIISLVLILISANANAQQSSYVSQNKEMAETLSKEFGIPISIILAVAIVESGSGTSKASKTLNNHFGIVGKNTVNSSKYRSFSSVQESYRAFCELLSRKKYYSKLKGNNNHQEWIKAIASAGYSTQPQEWMRRISLVANKLKL
ncbi:MAG: glucosaminidase domain-containing protein [Flavobacteriaceae bacterium]|nr:glucosaminidase domain-containing protein [Flavobacteriaceae bacterium]